MHHKAQMTVGAFTALFIVSLGGAVADDFAIDRYTVDCGGAMFTTGGEFELSGTVGQPDAGVMSGGEFTLWCGYWIGIVPGDLDEDGDVDLHDFAAFQACLAGPDGRLGLDCGVADFDADADVDLVDFASFQLAFSG